MLRRLKLALVESYVGAIAVGWLLAQGIMHFASIFTAPLTDWFARKEYWELTNRPGISRGFPFESALPELAKSVSLLFFFYLLLRWLYFRPVEPKSAETTGVRSDPG